MNIQYHVASVEDIDKISRQITESYAAAYKGVMDDCYLASLTKQHWSSILRDSLSSGDTCIFAQYCGIIIGSTVFGTLATDGGICAQWHAFYLLPQYIGCGIGHLFYQHIEEEMTRQKCTYCALEVLASNARAIRFYLSHGFNKTAAFTVEENGTALLCDKMIKKLSVRDGV